MMPVDSTGISSESSESFSSVSPANRQRLNFSSCELDTRQSSVIDAKGSSASIFQYRRFDFPARGEVKIILELFMNSEFLFRVL